MHCRTCAKEVLEQAVVCVGCGCPPLAGNKFCQHCGAETNPAASVCVKCGVSLKNGGSSLKTKSPANSGNDLVIASDPPKDPILMALLSGCLVAWLGQIILGQKSKGFVMLGVTVLLAIVTVGLSILITWPMAGVDAYLIGKKLKDGKAVRQWEFF